MQNDLGFLVDLFKGQSLTRKALCTRQRSQHNASTGQYHRVQNTTARSCSFAAFRGFPQALDVARDVHTAVVGPQASMETRPHRTPHRSLPEQLVTLHQGFATFRAPPSVRQQSRKHSSAMGGTHEGERGRAGQQPTVSLAINTVLSRILGCCQGIYPSPCPIKVSQPVHHQTKAT